MKSTAEGQCGVGTQAVWPRAPAHHYTLMPRHVLHMVLKISTAQGPLFLLRCVLVSLVSKGSWAKAEEKEDAWFLHLGSHLISNQGKSLNNCAIKWQKEPQVLNAYTITNKTKQSHNDGGHFADQHALSHPAVTSQPPHPLNISECSENICKMLSDIGRRLYFQNGAKSISLHEDGARTSVSLAISLNNLQQPLLQTPFLPRMF